MDKNNFADYIKTELSKGAPKEQIESNLNNAGWNPEAIQKAFAETESTPITSDNKAPISSKKAITNRLVLSILVCVVLIYISFLISTGNEFGCGGSGNCNLEMQMITGFPFFLGILAFPFGTIFLILFVYLLIGIGEEVIARIKRRSN